MEPDEVRRMAEEEDRMWWYAGLHARLLDALDRPLGRVLDAGCGTGGLLRLLDARGMELDGIDRDPLAVEIARSRTRASVVEGDVQSLPYADATFDAIVLADVLYHRGVDPPAALAECARCLRPGGIVVINAPAYEWLRGAHDEPIHTARRFTAGGLSRLVRAAGLVVEVAAYWNAILFPLMVVRRKMLPARGSDVRPYSPLADRAFRGALALERALLPKAPFGGSVFVVGRRDA